MSLRKHKSPRSEVKTISTPRKRAKLSHDEEQPLQQQEAKATAASASDDKSSFAVCACEASDAWDVIQYLQNQIKSKNFAGDSFWNELPKISAAVISQSLFGIWRGGQLVGYMVFQKHTGEIELLETFPEARRSGAGATLVQFALEQAAEEPALTHVFFHAALHGSEPFWRAMGFEQEQPRKADASSAKKLVRATPRKKTLSAGAGSGSSSDVSSEAGSGDWRRRIRADEDAVAPESDRDESED